MLWLRGLFDAEQAGLFDATADPPTIRQASLAETRLFHRRSHFRTRAQSIPARIE